MKNSRFSELLPPAHGELISESYSGSKVIRSIVQKSSASRLHLEKRLLPGIEVGLPDWERAHSQGRITGHESAHGIVYAPREVNQITQRLGIERFIAELYQIKDQYEKREDNLTIVLTTSTSTHKMLYDNQLVETNCLKEITYVIQVHHPKQKRFITMFEATIEVDKPGYTTIVDGKEIKPNDPRVSLSVDTQLSGRLLYSKNPFY
jgi:Bacterial toxin 4